MNDDGRDITGLSNGEEDLAGRLARLGPLMLEQERFEGEMDQVFARNLRAHLIYGEEQAPDPGVARNLRPRLLRQGAAHPAGGPVRRRLIAGIGATTLALAALLVGVLVAVLLPQQAHAPSFGAPYPTRADLIFSFPAPPTVIRRLLPTVSLVHPRPGIPYAGHLQLRAARLPATPRALRAYRLASPSNVMVRGRRLLGIRSPIRHVVVGSATWIVAADGGSQSHRPLHSLAVSRATGELIYHDRRNHKLPRATRAAPRSVAVTAARRWLVRLGWPGERMPLIEVEQVQRRPKVREVEFGWIGVGRTETAAATLWVTPDRSVIEAWVWPPAVQAGAVPHRSVAAAWNEVRRGQLPLAVEGVSPSIRADGSGSVRRASVVSILSLGGRGSTYLVPVYRFEGKAHIPGASTHTWYTLAPGAKKGGHSGLTSAPDSLLQHPLGQAHPDLAHHRVAEEAEHATAAATSELAAQDRGKGIRVVVADVLSQASQLLRAHLLPSDAKLGEHAVGRTTALRDGAQQQVGQTVALLGVGVTRAPLDALAEAAATQGAQGRGDGADPMLVRRGLEHLGYPAVQLFSFE